MLKAKTKGHDLRVTFILAQPASFPNPPSATYQPQEHISELAGSRGPASSPWAVPAAGLACKAHSLPRPGRSAASLHSCPFNPSQRTPARLDTCADGAPSPHSPPVRCLPPGPQPPPTRPPAPSLAREAALVGGEAAVDLLGEPERRKRLVVVPRVGRDVDKHERLGRSRERVLHQVGQLRVAKRHVLGARGQSRDHVPE
mmetsp:Transcript_17000/g.55396  ORF Transcript_17000/g.55396 Transcript_17000/m.55396 type:complete len:200 (-) Transcript_17000:542-1141(-)